MDRIELNVAKEFSETPGPRTAAEGDYSGEDFLRLYLKPRFNAAREKGCTLHVNLDGGAGYATSFLEATFGGLARAFGAEVVLSTLEFTSNDEPYLVDEIRQYIREARA